MNKSPFCADNYASWLNRLSRLKRHLLEKMSIVCWLGSVPHTSGKAVNLSPCINIFPLVLYVPNDPLYDKGSGAWSWLVSKASSHAYLNSTAAPPHTHPLHRMQEICAELSSAPDVRDDSIQKRLTLKPSVELLNGAKLEGSCFHASINMFSCILIHVSQKVENRIRHFQNLGRRNVFNKAVSLFKRGVYFPLHPLKPTWVQHVDVLVFHSLGGASFRGSLGSLRLARKWWDGDKYPALSASTTLNATTAGQSAAPIGRQNKTKQKRETGQETKYPFHAPVCLPATC